MMGFWIAAVVLILLALAFVLPPLLRQGKRQVSVTREDINVSVYRDQLKELDNDLANGTIEQDQYDQARKEIERSLLADVAAEEDGQEPAQAAGAKTTVIPAIAVAVVVPILAVGLYASIGGGPQAFNPDQAAPQVQTDEHRETIESMVGKLAQRLEQNPEDIDGWFMLGRSFQFLKQYEQADQAFQRVMALGGGGNPDFLATYADVKAMLNDGRIAGASRQLIDRALQVDPNHVKALWLAGTAEYQEQDLKGALEYWQRLHNVLPPGSEDQQAIAANIGEVRSRLGMAPMAQASATANTGNASVSGTVELADSVAAQADPNDTVFIFARAANGPRMPLAIVRKQVKDLPYQFTLDDSMAMNPAMTLSSANQVVVGARVSKSGNAMPQPGDLEGYSQSLSVADAGLIQVVIDRAVQ